MMEKSGWRANSAREVHSILCCPVISADEKAVRHIQLDDLVRQLKKRMEQSHPSMPVENSTILVVDDDEGIRSLLKQELTEAGYHVQEAVDGKDAIAKIV